MVIHLVKIASIGDSSFLPFCPFVGQSSVERFEPRERKQRRNALTVGSVVFLCHFWKLVLMKAPATQFRVEINIAASLPHVLINNKMKSHDTKETNAQSVNH